MTCRPLHKLWKREYDASHFQKVRKANVISNQRIITIITKRWDSIISDSTFSSPELYVKSCTFSLWCFNLPKSPTGNAIRWRDDGGLVSPCWRLPLAGDNFFHPWTAEFNIIGYLKLWHGTHARKDYSGTWFILFFWHFLCIPEFLQSNKMRKEMRAMNEEIYEMALYSITSVLYQLIRMKLTEDNEGNSCSLC